MLSHFSWKRSVLVLSGVGAVSTRVRHSDGAGVRRCRLLYPCISLASSMSCHLTSTRKLFGHWGISKSGLTTTDGQNPTAATCADSSATESDTSLTAAQVSALTSEAQQLRQQVSDLKGALENSQEALKQLLILSASKTPHPAWGAAAAAHASAPAATTASSSVPSLDGHQHRQGTCCVVRTSEELMSALRGHGSERTSLTVLLNGKLFILDPYAPVVVNRTRVSIVGNNAIIIGRIAVKGRGALLSASDVFFLELGDMQLRSVSRDGGDEVSTTAAAAEATAPLLINPRGRKEKGATEFLMPVVSATVGAGVHLDRCTLSSGRDGVYLGMGSHCTLNRVRIVNCIRGLYEGVGCRTSMLSACTFQSNRYHMVLLGPNNAERAARVFCGASGTRTAAVASPSAAADTEGPAYSVVFTSAASAADVLAPGFTSDGAIATQQTKAQVVLQHCPITDVYSDCWCDGAKVELSAQDATAGLSDPLF
ncbi:hypothetical protein, conserved [Leishmania donovani]|nr:hypothetical protein, conserved [Leishmania donovani]AYU77615.1 hypothetical protein LdCL_160008700 [Leishmania donovani]CBZ33018.1 hypothetical protein, conserved [Leishmania donovani]VDZ43512.1 hypothetical_protein_conserved [Leishmania donovani]